MHQTEPLTDDESDEPGPNVESENREQRIAARRSRITARNEARKRKELGEDSLGKEDDKDEIRKSQAQVNQSQRHMAKLLGDGLELVTNIQVAADARESNRRTEQEEARRLRREKLENEAKSSQEKHEEIIHKWTDTKMKQTPLDLRDALNSQQELCVQLIEEKNKLIDELQQELKAGDDRYVKDLKRQAKDIDLLIERMEEQITNVKKSYREELDQIENSFDEERRTLLTSDRKKWEYQMKERRDKELKNMMQGLSLMEEYEDLLQKLRVQKAEEYNIVNIRLDTEVQNLQQKVQQMKAIYDLNQEKLEYKFKVLKKREEENAIVKSQVKRKLTRTQALLNNLKSKCAEQEKRLKQENQSLSKDYTRINQQYKDMQRKARQFAALDAERFEKLWLMNEAEVKALVHRALEIDRVIHQQQLGLEWAAPPLSFMERTGPIVIKLEDLRTARWAAADALREDEQVENTGSLEEGSECPQKMGDGMDRTTVKKVLNLLCDEAGFLIESKLLKLTVSSLETNEQSLIKLDAIFSALGIESEEDVHKMTEFFMKYRQQSREQKEQAEVEETASDQQPSDLISRNDLLVALKDFTAQYCRSREVQFPQQSSVLELDLRDDSEDAVYWESMANVIPESKLKLWSALETSLNKYHTVLTKRAELLVETQKKKQQNIELRQLLHQYLTSKVGAELETPPTTMRQ